MVVNENVVQAKKVELNKNQLNLITGQEETLKLKGTKKKIEWSTSNKKVATVNVNGVVKAKKYGEAKIVARVGKKKYICNVNVIPFEGKKYTFQTGFSMMIPKKWEVKEEKGNAVIYQKDQVGNMALLGVTLHSQQNGFRNYIKVVKETYTKELVQQTAENLVQKMYKDDDINLKVDSYHEMVTMKETYAIFEAKVKFQKVKGKKINMNFYCIVDDSYCYTMIAPRFENTTVDIETYIEYSIEHMSLIQK